MIPVRIKNFPAVPSNQFFGFKLIAHSENSVELSMTVRQEFLQEYGVVHGAILTAIADTAAVYLFYPYIEQNQKMTSIEFKVNFLSAAFVHKGSVNACAKIVKKGKKIGVADVEVFQAEKILLKGLFTYLFFE